MSPRRHGGSWTNPGPFVTTRSPDQTSTFGGALPDHLGTPAPLPGVHRRATATTTCTAEYSCWISFPSPALLARRRRMRGLGRTGHVDAWVFHGARGLDQVAGDGGQIVINPSSSATIRCASSSEANAFGSPGSSSGGTTSEATARCQASIARIVCRRTSSSACSSTWSCGAPSTITGPRTSAPRPRYASTSRSPLQSRGRRGARSRAGVRLHRRGMRGREPRSQDRRSRPLALLRKQPIDLLTQTAGRLGDPPSGCTRRPRVARAAACLPTAAARTCARRSPLSASAAASRISVASAFTLRSSRAARAANRR